jgi:hypothetical protein
MAKPAKRKRPSGKSKVGPKDLAPRTSGRVRGGAEMASIQLKTQTFTNEAAAGEQRSAALVAAQSSTDAAIIKNLGR